jgi:glutaminyl-tRNA synthetase
MIGLLMIKDGKAYIDSQSSEDMAKQKGTPQPGVDGPYRNRSVQENLTLFEGMKMVIFQKEVTFCVLKLTCPLIC